MGRTHRWRSMALAACLVALVALPGAASAHDSGVTGPPGPVVADLAGHPLAVAQIPAGAPVEGVPLDDHHRSSKAWLGPGRLGEIRPPDLALRDHHSFVSRTRRETLSTNGCSVSESPTCSATRSRASVTSSGACRATYSRSAALYTSLRDRRERWASRSTLANNSSGTETAVFIPGV
jgi:hypothetical protein